MLCSAMNVHLSDSGKAHSNNAAGATKQQPQEATAMPAYVLSDPRVIC